MFLKVFAFIFKIFFRKSITEKWCGQGHKEGRSNGWQTLESDEAKDLKTLQLMARKEYLFACYEVVLEEKTDEEDKIQDCNCGDDEARADEHWHFCPGHKEFKPNINCKDHVECNDPIFR